MTVIGLKFLPKCNEPLIKQWSKLVPLVSVPRSSEPLTAGGFKMAPISARSASPYVNVICELYAVLGKVYILMLTLERSDYGIFR
jgi:hypothetical protein